MKYIKQFAVILAITFLGEICKYSIPLPIPSGIYGLVFLFLGLSFKLIKLENVENAADFLIEIMPLMFIPAAVGLLESKASLMAMLLPLIAAIIVGTPIIMAVSGIVTQFLMKKGEKDHE